MPDRPKRMSYGGGLAATAWLIVMFVGGLAGVLGYAVYSRPSPATLTTEALSQGDARRACAIIATETTRALDAGDVEGYKDWRFRERETCEGFPAAVPVRR